MLVIEILEERGVMKFLLTKLNISKGSFFFSFIIITASLFAVVVNQIEMIVPHEYIGYGLAMSLSFLAIGKYFDRQGSVQIPSVESKESLDSKVYEFVGVNYMIFHKTGELKRNASNIKGLDLIYNQKNLMDSFHNVKRNEFLLKTTGEKYYLKIHELNDFNIIDIKEVYKEVNEKNNFSYDDLFYEAWVELFSSDLCFKQKVHFSYGDKFDVNIGLEEVENLKKVLKSIYLFTQRIDSVSSVNVSIKSFQESVNIKLKYFDTDSSIEKLKEINFSSSEDSLFQRFYNFETCENGDSKYKIDIFKEESKTNINTFIDIGISNEFEGLTC